MEEIARLGGVNFSHFCPLFHQRTFFFDHLCVIMCFQMVIFDALGVIKCLKWTYILYLVIELGKIGAILSVDYTVLDRLTR